MTPMLPSQDEPLSEVPRLWARVYKLSDAQDEQAKTLHVVQTRLGIANDDIKQMRVSMATGEQLVHAVTLLTQKLETLDTALGGITNNITRAVWVVLAAVIVAVLSLVLIKDGPPPSLRDRLEQQQVP